MARRLLTATLLMLALGFFLGTTYAGEPPTNGGTAVVLQIEGVIGPATASYISKGLASAAAQNASLIILRMDTPGGLDTSMRTIIQEILASPVPVASFVSPSGARAASAGTYIMYASHVSAMMPGTNLGAATPVQIGGTPDLPQPPESSDDQDAPTSEKPSDVMEAKAVNDAVAYIRSLAQMRGRNANWAERAVRQASSLSASDALNQQVIDVVAVSTTDLLTQIDGRSVQINDTNFTLNTKTLELVQIKPDWRTELLGAITNPNVALILMMIGVYGLIFEFMNPGSIYPGTIGAICLIIGLYALAALPVNYAGAGLIVLGLLLIVAEAFAPSFGALGIGGAIAFVLGAAILIDTDSPAFAISWPIVIGTTVSALAFSLVVVRMAISSQGRQIVSGRDQMIGQVGKIQDWHGLHGHMLVHGERWQAVCTVPLTSDQKARVISIDGLTLHVEPETVPEN